MVLCVLSVIFGACEEAVGELPPLELVLLALLLLSLFDEKGCEHFPALGGGQVGRTLVEAAVVPCYCCVGLVLVHLLLHALPLVMLSSSSSFAFFLPYQSSCQSREIQLRPGASLLILTHDQLHRQSAQSSMRPKLSKFCLSLQHFACKSCQIHIGLHGCPPIVPLH